MGSVEGISKEIGMEIRMVQPVRWGRRGDVRGAIEVAF